MSEPTNADEKRATMLASACDALRQEHRGLSETQVRMIAELIVDLRLVTVHVRGDDGAITSAHRRDAPMVETQGLNARVGRRRSAA